MRALVVGLGSMGKRRVRNLRALQVADIVGVDPRRDRREESAQKYGIPTYGDIDGALKEFSPDAFVISTSPEKHMDIAWRALARRIPCFIEASVVDADRVLELHNAIAATDLLMAPSCTMRFFPGPKKVKELVQDGAIGRVLNVNYQTGQYLPDWHPWESIQDFYVSKRATGGCREIVPFELTWMNDVFGEPEPLACVKAKLTDMPADIDDVYHCVFRYPGQVLANLTVEVISRPAATRELRILGSEGLLVFSADENCVRYASSSSPNWSRFDLGQGSVESGYINPEEPYIAEMQAFIEAIKRRDRAYYPNTLLADYRILATLNRLDQLSEQSQ